MAKADRERNGNGTDWNRFAFLLETIHSQEQLFEPERRLAWTGAALTAKAVHVWELKPESGSQTLVAVTESMDGPLIKWTVDREDLSVTKAQRGR
jgi:hypothetical protein